MKNYKVRLMLGYCIAIMPTNILRILLYRYIFGYDIYQSIIGWNTIIAVNNAKLHKCNIGRNNKFIGPMKIVIKNGASIGKGNTFNCGWWTIQEKFAAKNYKRYLEIGENTLITGEHYFDIADAFILGSFSWIGGISSQFWTHGAGTDNRDIYIGEHCYIGSAVRFSPGSSVGNNTIVALGSVVTRDFDMENVAIGGQPAKVLKKDYDWKSQSAS